MVETSTFHVEINLFLNDSVIIIFCTVNIVEYERLKLCLICIYWYFCCLNGITTSTNSILPQHVWEELFPPSGNLFYFRLPFHFSLFYLFIFLFRLLSSSCCALLGRFGRCLGRGDDRTPSIMQNVSTVTAWQPWRAAIASCVGGVRDTKTTRRQGMELKHTLNTPCHLTVFISISNF